MEVNIKKVNFDVCTFCNHKCSFCSNPDERTAKTLTSLEDFLTVMEKVASYADLTEIGLSAKGEPLLNKQLAAMIKLCKELYNIPYVYISSNGALLNEKRARELFTAGLDSVKFSINALDRKSYAKIHGKDEFDLVMANLSTALRLKAEEFPDVKVMISSVVEESEDEVADFFRKSLGNSFPLIDRLWRYDLLFTPIAAEGDANVIPQKKCAIPFTEVYINADCHLIVCCVDYFSEVDFGSLLTNDFADLWLGARFQELRGWHNDNAIPKDHICARCLAFTPAEK